PLLREGNINTSIQWVAEKMKQHNLDVTFDACESPPEPVNENIQITLVQCMEELLFNVVKHADTDQARIQLSCLDQQIKMMVEDEGKGFDSDKKELKMTADGGFGLFNIRERVEILGGRMDIQSKPGKGTKISLMVPLENSDTELQDEQLSGEEAEQQLP